MPASPAVVLMGPAGTGKSTAGAALATRLETRLVDIDESAGDWYAEVGWSVGKLVERIRAVGRLAAEDEWEVARAHAVVRAVQSCPGAVLALGAGHTSYTDHVHAATASAALSTVPMRVLLLPHTDRHLALAELRRRCMSDKGTDWTVEGVDLLARWYDDPWVRAQATATIIGADRSPDEIAAEIAALV